MGTEFQERVFLKRIATSKKCWQRFCESSLIQSISSLGTQALSMMEWIVVDLFQKKNASEKNDPSIEMSQSVQDSHPVLSKIFSEEQKDIENMNYIYGRLSDSDVHDTIKNYANPKKDVFQGINLKELIQEIGVFCDVLVENDFKRYTFIPQEPGCFKVEFKTDKEKEAFIRALKDLVGYLNNNIMPQLVHELPFD